MKQSWLIIALFAAGVAALFSLRPPSEPGETLGYPRSERELAPIVRPTDPVLGNRNAEYTIIEYGDFSCPACASLSPVLAEVRAELGDRVRIIWKDLPHREAIIRSRPWHVAARCAQRQGAFWGYHDALFTLLDTLPPQSEAELVNIAQQLQLDVPTFSACLSDPGVDLLIDADIQDAERLRIDGTPTVYLNGIKFDESLTVRAILDTLSSQ
jgi:protein-disulfide isomerase